MIRYISYPILFLFFINFYASASITSDNEGKNDGVTDTTVVKNILLTEVAINGNKEPLTIKQLPTASTIMNKKMLEDYRPESLRDISYMAPNVFMPEYGSKLTAPVYIRGIGSRLNSPSIGLYVDNVPYMEKSAFDFDFFDVERIEVLRGPQGTMYGRNTMGGILLVRTRSPFENPGVVARATAGNYGAYDFNAGIYNAVKEKFGYSLSLNHKHNDGYFRNVHLNSLVDKLDSWSARNKLIYSFNPNLSIENIASFEDSRQIGYPYAVYDSKTSTTFPVSYDIESSYDRKLFSDALVVRWNTDNFDLTSNTSFQHLDDEQHTDQDFTTQSLFYMLQKQKQNTVSQEVVMRSRGDSRYKWVNGVYGFHQSMDTDIDIQSFPGKYVVQIGNGLTTYGGALFHQSFFKLFPKLTIGAGVRYDIERSELDSKVVMNKTVTLPGGVIKTVSTTMADTLYPGSKTDELMPRFSLSYQLGDGELYAVASKGYKTGGFNNLVMKPEDLSFRAERSWNYEVGYRFSMFDNFLTGEAAAFYIDWRNHQFAELVMNGQGLMIKNADKSRSKGVELSLTTRPWNGFNMMASYGFTDARFVKYEKSAIVNFNDNKIPNAPRNTFMTQLNKEFKLNSGSFEFIRLSATYRGAGRIYWNEENEDYQSFYGVVDASVSTKMKDFKLSVWSKNILDEKYHTFFFNTLNTDYVQLGRPATFGVTLEYQLPLVR